MSAVDFRITVTPRLSVCAGNEGRCGGAPRYEACVTVEHRDITAAHDVLLCEQCAAVVRTWPILDWIRTIPRSTDARPVP